MQTCLAPLGTAQPVLMEQLVTICQNFIKTGTPKQAKQAVKCLHMNATDTQVRDPNSTFSTESICSKYL